MVANRHMHFPRSPFIQFIQVEKHLDAADSYIVQNLEIPDLVITADVPLAGLVVEKGAVAINPRGETYSAKNIAERLSVRNFLDEMRGAGAITGGPPAFSDKDKHRFAAALDRYLAASPKP